MKLAVIILTGATCHYGLRLWASCASTSASSFTAGRGTSTSPAKCGARAALYVTAIRDVHLGIKSARLRGVQCGYSQVANADHFVRKGTVPAFFALPLMFMNICGQLRQGRRSEPYVDRRDRLRGNVLAILNVATGRVEPEYVLKI